MHILLHIITITRHRHQVIKNCFKAGIGVQGLFHDLSKYSFAELWPSAKLYQGTRSPNERARELYGYSAAWLHHKGRNKHHFEYWSDINIKTKRYEPVKMPERYLKEMVCDRIAASKIYKKENYTDSSALNYLLNSTDKASMHPETYSSLYFLLKMLSENGEDELFSYMRNHRLYLEEKDD